MENIFFEPNLTLDNFPFILNEKNTKHSMLVLRKRVNDFIYLTNGNGLVCETNIISIQKKEVVVTLKKQSVHLPPKQKISVAISPLHNIDRFEFLIEKITEIGVQNIIPIHCVRTQFIKFKKERIQSIIISAIEQSKQFFLPKLFDVISFQECIKNFTATPQKLLMHCMPDFSKINIHNIVPNDEIIICIGPEGDFTKEEIEMAKNHHFNTIHLGENRLRTETAAIFAVSKLKL